MGKRIDKFLAKYGYKRIRRSGGAFEGSSIDRLYSSWTTLNQSADTELFTNLKTLRARSRELERNNDYAKKFLRMTRTNVVGKVGIRLQSMVMTNGKKSDDTAREKIETAFKEWSEKGVCDVTGTYSFRDIQKMVISSIARDGEVFVRRVRNFDNDFKYALQLIESDHADENFNDERVNNNVIRMSIELGEFGKPVAYHLWPTHPGDFRFGQTVPSERLRIPESQVFHLFVKNRISQNRGMPWFHAAMTRLNMLGAYEEAELVASRIAANKNIFYKRGDSSEYVGDDSVDGSPIQEQEPGINEILPNGWDIVQNDPQHPTTQFGDFEKAILRGIASGLDVSYNFLANDLEGVNFSSIRAGVQDERDVWRDIQKWFIDHFMMPVFHDWLEMSLLTGAVKLPFSGFDRFKAARFFPRGWEWVDPLKDSQSKLMDLENGLTTASEIAAGKGQDLEEIYATLEREKALRDKFNIEVAYDEQTD